MYHQAPGATGCPGLTLRPCGARGGTGAGVGSLKPSAPAALVRFFFFPFFFSSSSSSSSPTRWDPLSPKLMRGQRNARRNCNVVSALAGHTCSEKATAIERDPKIFSSDSVLSVPPLAGPWVRRQHLARGSGVLGEKKAEPPSGS